MRILVLSDLPPDVNGGAEHQALKLCREWLRAGHEIRVIGHRTDPGLRDIGTGRVEVLRPGVLYHTGRAGRAASFAWSMGARLRSQRHWAEVIYSRFLGESALVTCLLKSLGVLKQPLCLTPGAGGGASADAQMIRSLPLWQRWFPGLIAHCEAINVIAATIEVDLDALGVPRQTRTHIPNGVELPARPEIGAMREGPIRLLTTGRLEHQKGQDVLLAALALPAMASIAFTLDIVGDGRCRQALSEQIEKLGLGSRVTLHGALSHPASMERMAAADLFVLPSRYEGFSNAALEAMASARPLVITRCGGVDAEVTPDCGWTCAADDPQALSQCLVQACTTPREHLVVMGMQARKIVEARYSIAVTAQQHLQLFRELAAGHSAAEAGLS